MPYNILDDENRWQERYKNYLSKLTMDELLKELNYIVNSHIHPLAEFEELAEVKVRVNLISLVIKQKYEEVKNETNCM